MAITLTDEDITALKRYQQFVQDYYVDFDGSEGIIQPLNDRGELVDGALCLGTGKPGPTIAIDAMMHKNEPAGIAAQIDIIERWQKGDRPKQGSIMLTLGTPPRQFGFRDAVVDLIDLTAEAHEIFKGSSTQGKRRLINFVFSNLQLEGKKLRFSLRQPFDLFVGATNYQEWRALQDSNLRPSA